MSRDTDKGKANRGQSTPRRRVRSGCGAVFFCFMVVVAAVWGACLGAFVWYVGDAGHTIRALDEFRPRIGSKVYSADGELLGEFTKEWRQLVPLNQMPLHLQKAFVATEDDKFYQHRGVRIDAIVNAALYIVRTGGIRGGSTITQQLVRNVDTLDVGEQRTLQRKLREAIVALQVEREYTKDEILELYLNQLFLGKSARGVEAAAQQYFAKSCRELTIAESALLAGLARSPNRNRPDLYPDNAVRRRDIVLGQMLDNGMITREQHDAALGETLEGSLVTEEERLAMMRQGEGALVLHEFNAPYFVEETRQHMMQQGLTNEDELFEHGLQIRTTIDMHLQRAAEKALGDALDEFDKNKLEYLQARGREDEFVPVTGALVCIDNRPGAEGYVRALVGGRDWERSKYNNATQAKRQPGSSVKPFVWAAALSTGLQTGITPSTMEVDEEIVRYDDLGRAWRPKNFDNKYDGPVTLRRALERSKNIISVKLVERVGMPRVRRFMQKAGITTPINDSHVRTIALGSPEVTVLDHCVAYSTFAKGGTYAPPVFITGIKDRDGFSIYRHQIKKTPEVIDPALAYVVTYLLEGVARYGTGARSRPLDRPRTGKTGTTNESRNVWFCGYTPQYTCVVWVGYRDNRPLGHGIRYTGGRIACPIWTTFMVEAHKGLPVMDFKVPEGVAFYPVDRETGLLDEASSFKEAFLEGTQPPTEIPAFEESELLEEMMEQQLLESVRF